MSCWWRGYTQLEQGLTRFLHRSTSLIDWKDNNVTKNKFCKHEKRDTPGNNSFFSYNTIQRDHSVIFTVSQGSNCAQSNGSMLQYWPSLRGKLFLWPLGFGARDDWCRCCFIPRVLATTKLISTSGNITLKDLSGMFFKIFFRLQKEWLTE